MRTTIHLIIISWNVIAAVGNSYMVLTGDVPRYGNMFCAAMCAVAAVVLSWDLFRRLR